MTSELDCRGLACPAPVLQTKGLLEKVHPAEVRVIVDNEAAKQNVSRFLQSQNFNVSLEKAGDHFLVIGRTQGQKTSGPPTASVEAQKSKQKILVMIPTDRLGFGDDELGKKLVISFIRTLKEMGDELWRLVLVNNGVKLTIADSPVLSDLKNLEKSGITVLVCGTCLEHFRLMDKKEIGQTTNMLDIVTAMQLADKTITI